MTTMTNAYDDRTVEELRDELRDRDLKVSGSKDELVERLEEDDAGNRDDANSGDGQAGPTGRPATGLREVVDRIRRELRAVTGLRVESTSGLERDGDGWTARVEVLELERIPHTTDVLATYAVHADDAGSITAFDRIRRYRRSEADG